MENRITRVLAIVLSACLLGSTAIAATLIRTIARWIHEETTAPERNEMAAADVATTTSESATGAATVNGSLKESRLPATRTSAGARRASAAATWNLAATG